VHSSCLKAKGWGWKREVEDGGGRGGIAQGCWRPLTRMEKVEYKKEESNESFEVGARRRENQVRNSPNRVSVLAPAREF
jgi:hypothetical protein